MTVSSLEDMISVYLTGLSKVFMSQNFSIDRTGFLFFRNMTGTEEGNAFHLLPGFGCRLCRLSTLYVLHGGLIQFLKDGSLVRSGTGW